MTPQPPAPVRLPPIAPPVHGSTAAREASPPRQPTATAVTVAAAAVLLGAAGILIGLLLSRQGSNTSAPTPPVTVPGPTVTQSAPRPEPPQTRTVTRAPPRSATSAAPNLSPDPDAAAAAQLRQLADNDRPLVKAELSDLWVPQLSSKRPGIVDDGIVWDNVHIRQEHLALRQRYDAKLLWSGDWSTFDAPNFWVTVVPVTFDSPEGALGWCTDQGFDSWHCIAKLISTTHPVPGSTATG